MINFCIFDKTKRNEMTTEDFYKNTSPYLWKSDRPQKDEGFFGKEDMKRFAEEYHQAKLKELGKADVIEQSEQLIAFSKWKEEKGYHPIYDHKELVEEYLKSL